MTGIKKAILTLFALLLIGSGVAIYSPTVSATTLNPLTTAASTHAPTPPPGTTLSPEEAEIIENVSFEEKCRSDVGALSWILCPVVEFANDVTKFAADFILSTLETKPLTTDMSDTNVMFTAWKVFRSLANFLLILAFLVVIYLLATGGSQYQLQRMLPRLVVVVILVQLSYLISAIIVDFGNVLASGIEGIFEGINRQVISDEVSRQLTSDEATSLLSLSDNGYSGAEIAGLGTTWLLFASISAFAAVFAVGVSFGAIMLFLIGLMLAALVALIALALRQLLIVIFIVSAPIVFVFGIFPQTEKWMREWFDNFGKIILIYPLVALIFGISSTLSLLSLETKGRDFNQIFAALLPIIALALIPVTFRFAGGLFRTISGGMTSFGKRTSDAIKGDPSNPFSARYRANYKRNYNKGMAAMGLTDFLGREKKEEGFQFRVPGVGRKYHPANFISRRLNKSLSVRQAYQQGAALGEDRLSKVFKDPIHGLFLGDRNITGWRGALNYSPSKASMLFRHGEGKNWFKDRTLYTTAALGTALKLAAGGHPDYALAFMHGNLMNDLTGAVKPEYAEEFDASFRDEMRGKHAYAKGASYEYRKKIQEEAYARNGQYLDDIQMTRTMYVTPLSQLDGATKDSVKKIRSNFINDWQGGLNEQQAANTFEFAQAVMEDTSMLEAYVRNNDGTVDQGAVDKLVAGYKKAASFAMKTRDSERDSYAQTQTGGDTSFTDALAGTYKTPSDLVAQEQFMNARGNLRDFLINQGVDPNELR